MALVYTVAGVIFMYLLGKEMRNELTGVLAATLLAVNHIFLFYSVRPLADSPMLVTTIILLYCMVKLEKEKKVIWGYLTGLMFLVSMLTKVQASLFVLALLIYYLIFKRKEMITHIPTRISWLIPVGSVLVAHIIGKLVFKAAILDRIFKLFLTTRGMPYGFEALGMLQWIFSWYLIPFIIIGVLLVFLYKQKQYYFSLILLLFYWLFFEVNVDNTQDRYVLPLLSVAIILAAFAIEEIGTFVASFTRKKVRFVIVIGILLLVSFQFYNMGIPLVESRSGSYAGHPEAGQWIQDNVPEEAIIFAGSPRMVRAFSEREYYQGGHDDSVVWGGTLRWLRHDRYLEKFNPGTARQNFEEDIALFTKESDIYLEFDVWEYTQPEWYFPIRQESFDYFQSLGFYPVKVVERDASANNGRQRTPVIFILKKDREV